MTEISRDRITAEVGSPVFYAGFVELGTEKKSARPYLRPAVDENQEQATRALARALESRMKEMK